MLFRGQTFLFHEYIFRYLEVHARTSIDVIQENVIDDHMNVDGQKSLCDPWIGVTRFTLLNR